MYNLYESQSQVNAVKNSTYSDNPINTIRHRRYEDKDSILLLQTALTETKHQCDKLLQETESSKIRSVLCQFSVDRRSLIKCIERRLADEQQSLTLESVYAAKIANLYNDIESLINSQAIVFKDIIENEKRILEFVKWLLIASDAQPIRHWLSSLAASIQIGLDNLELQSH